MLCLHSSKTGVGKSIHTVIATLDI